MTARLGVSRRAPGVALAVVAALSGCQGTSTGSSEPTSSPPSSPTTDATAAGATPAPSVAAADILKATMTLAEGWDEIEMTEAALQSAVTLIEPTNPQVAATLSQLLASGQFKAIQLYALGYDHGAYLGNVNISSYPVGPMTFDLLAPLMESEFKAAGANDIASSRVVVAGMDALLLEYSLTLNPATGPVTVYGHAYQFIQNGRIYQATFSCNGPDTTRCFSQAGEMIQSFRLGR
jgi:hypothetical protein